MEKAGQSIKHNRFWLEDIEHIWETLLLAGFPKVVYAAPGLFLS